MADRRDRDGQDVQDDAASSARPRPGPLRVLATGASMGLADAVPGVSGGTIALIAGIYEDLIASIHRVLRGLLHLHRVEGRRDLARGLSFLLPLYAAAGVMVVIALKLLVGAKPEAEEPERLRRALAEADGLLLNPGTAPVVFAFFFGLVLASIAVPWREKRGTRGHDWLLAALAALISGGLALSPAVGGSTHALALLAAGALAVSVMLLPGISGSLALLVVGMYQPVASAVHDRDLAALTWFGCGMVLGAAVFVPCLRLMLARVHDRTMSCLSGLMAGSLVALWPWKAHYFPEGIASLGPMSPVTPHGAWWWSLLAMLLGMLTIRLMGRANRGRNDE